MKLFSFALLLISLTFNHFSFSSDNNKYLECVRNCHKKYKLTLFNKLTDLIGNTKNKSNQESCLTKCFEEAYKEAKIKFKTTAITSYSDEEIRTDINKESKLETVANKLAPKCAAKAKADYDDTHERNIDYYVFSAGGSYQDRLAKFDYIEQLKECLKNKQVK